MIRKAISVIIGLMTLANVCLAQKQSLTVQATNPSDFSRESETISISWESLKPILSEDTPKFVEVFESGSKTQIMSQVFGANAGGSPDCLIFQSDFNAHESKTFVISTTTNQPKPGVPLVDARFVKPREDLAWENDRIAFRMYGPALAAEVNNGIDVWTKRVRYLIVKKWYEGEEQTPKIVYHEDHGEGADFFNVGRSLGCGGTGVWYEGRVYQPGVFSSYKIIATGPIRACFELYYDNWDIDGTKFKEVKRVTLDAGQNLNHIEVTLQNARIQGLTTLASGLVKRPNTTWYKSDGHDWMSLWGLTTEDTTNGYLGTGVVLAAGEFSGWAGDSSQYMAIGKMDNKGEFSYYAGAGWTKSGDFKSAEDWNSYLDRFAVNLRLPMLVSIVREQ